jgi:SAM-dependent methyltransferase
MNTLRHRRLQPEVMDRPDLEQDRHWQALRGLERINRLSNSAGILWPSIRRLAEESPGRSLRLLDVASGAGDVCLALYHRATRAKLSLHLEGADISRRAVDYAALRAQVAGASIRFFRWDALQEEFPAAYDVIFSSLFLHHLNEEQAVTLIKRMARATRRMILINDLARTRLGWTAAYLATRLLTTSDVVQTDALLSVEGAFTPGEALALAHHAGLRGATVDRRWPFRFLLTWRPE